ncbi:MAG: C45 family peptidase [Planctomycetota bacterium]|nr:C45 family peptidase [Planctomycetota bacterium]
MNTCLRCTWISLSCLALASCSVPTPTFAKVAAHQRSALYRYGSQQVLVLRGSPYQMGMDHGRLLGSAVRTVIREGLAWTHRAGLSRAQLTTISDQSWPHIPQTYKDEMRGLAEGSGALFQDIRMLHAMPSKFHCSGAAAAGSATVDGKLYHTRSLDYPLEIGVDDRMQNHAVLIVRQPDDGLANAVVSWAGFLGAVTGMNLAGISIGEMGSASRDEDYAGMPMIFMLREALRRARTLDQALEIFRRGPRTCGFNFIIGSGDEGLAVALEVTRQQFFVSGFGDPAENVAPHTAMNNMVRRTNHFVGENTARTQRRDGQGYHPEVYMAASWRRYQLITRYLEQARGRLDAQTMIDLLRKYPTGHACLHQAVMCATDRKIWVAQAIDDRDSPAAGAQNQQFYQYDLLELLRL